MSVFKKRRFDGSAKDNTQHSYKPHKEKWARTNLVDQEVQKRTAELKKENAELHKKIIELYDEAAKVNSQWNVHVNNLFKEKSGEINRLNAIIEKYLAMYPAQKDPFNAVAATV
tara:strand:- start:67 stop:408 length:342 start_codon:yes stop_codon:yes gene_type:complete